MNARTKVSSDGAVEIPQDVRDRLAWAPGTPLELVETADGVSLKRQTAKPHFALKTLEDLRALPGASGPAQPIEAISRLSDEDLRRLIP